MVGDGGAKWNMKILKMSFEAYDAKLPSGLFTVLCQVVCGLFSELKRREQEKGEQRRTKFWRDL